MKRQLFRILISLILALLLGFAVYGWNASVIAGNKLPMPLGVGMAVVLSGSMEPELSVDDLVFIRKTSNFHEKQIVVYQEENILVVHRIAEIAGDEITTKGDANDSFDAPIHADMIKGEVFFVIPYVGVIVEFLQKPISVLLMLGAAFGLFVYSVYTDKREKQAELNALQEEIRTLTEEINQ